MNDLIFLLGVLYAVAVLAGGASHWLRMPRVVGYLLGGLALMAGIRWGLPGLGWAGDAPWKDLTELLRDLDPIKEIALGFIMFDIGARFELAALRRNVRRMLPVALAEMGATLALVTGGLLAVGASWQVAVLLGVMGIATAPVTTIMVLRQYESEGPLTDHLQTLLAFNNAVSILLFGLAFVVVELVAGRGAAHRVATTLPWDILGSLGIGLVSGLLVSYLYERVAPGTRSTLVIALLISAIGLARLLRVPYMLALLVSGTLMANTTEYQREVRRLLDVVAAPLYVLFFVAAGAGLHVDALGGIGLVGLTYVAMRTLGKVGGAWLGARWAHSRSVVRRFAGWGLLSQAGAAIGLAILAGSRDAELGAALLAVVLAAVVVFEVAGPILLKTVLVRAGEVKVIHFLEHSPKPGYLTTVRRLFVRLSEALGFHRPPPRSLDSLRVRDVMVTNVKSIGQAAPFHEIIEFVDQSRHNIFPVVGADDRYLGYIPYRALQELMVDPALGRLLIARDFMETRPISVMPDGDLACVLDRYEATGLDALPVQDPEQGGRLVGLLEQRDVLRLLRRRIKRVEAREEEQGAASPGEESAAASRDGSVSDAVES